MSETNTNTTRKRWSQERNFEPDLMKMMAMRGVPVMLEELKALLKLVVVLEELEAFYRHAPVVRRELEAMRDEGIDRLTERYMLPLSFFKRKVGAQAPDYIELAQLRDLLAFRGVEREPSDPMTKGGDFDGN